MTCAAGDVRITDTTLRDGSHAVSHSFGKEHVSRVVHALDEANIAVIEVAHGDGLGGSSFNYGFSAEDDFSVIRAAVNSARRARIACVLLPGIGTTEHIRAAADAGARVIRIATHCTEADIAIQHLGVAHGLGLETVGFLMLSHMIDPDALAREARIMVDAGAGCVYVVDSAGAMVLHEVSERVEALVAEVASDALVGFHAHNNLGLAIANSVLAHRAGARQIDGSTCSLGAGAGNAATEILVAVFDRLGIRTGIDLWALLEAAEKVVRPLMPRELGPDRDAIVLGYAGAYSSFLLHAKRAAERYGVPAHTILAEVGRRRYVGGQEDMIIDIAIQLQRQKERLQT